MNIYKYIYENDKMIRLKLKAKKDVNEDKNKTIK